MFQTAIKSFSVHILNLNTDIYTTCLLALSLFLAYSDSRVYWGFKLHVHWAKLAIYGARSVITATYRLRPARQTNTEVIKTNMCSGIVLYCIRFNIRQF